MIERVAGIISAAPMPWIARLPISIAGSCARPAVAEVTAKMITP